MKKPTAQWSMRLFFSLLLSFLFMSMQAQVTVTGFVKDSGNEPLIGTTVAVKGTTSATITDVDGKYQLRVPDANVTLDFTYVGYTPQSIKLNGRTNLNVVLIEDSKLIDEVIVVGYGVQKKTSLTSAVSAINGDELLKAPSTNISSLLGGRLPGISSIQESGEPGLDKASLTIRGSRYGAVYIVDGFPRSINDIDPNDIESVSVLKDAAAASVYGLQASGGVIIVTTKKGKEGKAKITYNGSVGASMNANFPKFMNGPQFAHYYNMADMMDKLASGSITDRNQYVPIFTQEDIAMMTNNDPTDGWDNVDYIDKVFGTGTNQKHNVTVQGGNDNSHYLFSLGYLGQKGNIDEFKYRRYNLRTNIESNIGKYFKVSLGVAGNIGRRQTPGFAAGGTDANSELGEQGWLSIAHQTIAMHPYLPEKYEGLYTATPARNTNLPQSPLAAIYESGYKKTRSTDLQTNLSIEFKAPWVKGLSAKLTGAYDYGTSHNKNLNTPYQLNAIKLPDSTSKLGYAVVNDPRSTPYVTLGEGQYTSEQMIGQASLNYANSFDNHNLDFMLLAEARDNKSNSLSAYAKNLSFPELPELGMGVPDNNPIGGYSGAYRSIGYVYRLKYDYANKYLVELTGRYDGSYKFAGNVSGKRWGFFPSGSLAWRMTEESFMSDLTFLDDLKIRGSVGLLGNDNSLPAYAFLSTYAYGDKLSLKGTLNDALYTSVIANPNLTWEKTLSYNAGFDFTMWGGLLGMEFDAFYNYTYDILTYMGSGYPPSMGGYYPTYENYSKIETKGIEVLVKHNNKFALGNKPFNYDISGNMTYAKSRWLRYPDNADIPEIQRVTGSNVYATYGWISEGLFRSEEEIDQSAWYGSRPNLGDIKYKDVNGDGKIDNQDRGRIGRSNRPELMFGLNLGASWNGFDINAQFTGGALFDVSLTGTYYNGYDDNTIWTQTFKEGANSPLFLVENAYSIDNPNGSFPRITLGSASHGGDNGLASTFWFRDGKYIRLKSAQLGYTIPKKILLKAGIENLRLFIQGSNIFTISGLPDGVDPESPGVNNGYYPQQKTFMGGITLTF
ncbi:SusC/RagA family TonB-linked outer membrane protein [Dysgonomonas sp. 521]|uniref:SusC/RagA family TonB-linked outer membrane protein n=1 Tax=Dysgonomonas sp. 521 TaxID=2302932 RepID=UPI00351B6D90